MGQAAVRTAVIDGAGEPSPSREIAERIGTFRSLGGNCEFGFVQRYCGSEASGLLRFSFTPLDDLIHALETDFSEYGAPGDLHLAETENGYYYCKSRRYNIWANTRHAVGSIDPDALLERQYRKVAHLKLTMLEDLADGSKLLVRKTGPDDDPRDLDRLSGAIARHGPSTLLLVSEAEPVATCNPVRRLSDRMLAGSVRRFAAIEQAWGVDLEAWIALCEGAHALHTGIASPASRPAGEIRLSPRARHHRGRRRGSELNGFTRRLKASRFDPERIYVFSAWVWIADDFSGSRVGAVLAYDRLGWGDADLSLRSRWQRVWTAGRIRPDETRARAGVAMIGARNDRFWSCGWRLHEGVVPDAAAEPPDLRIEPWYRRPVSAWLP